MSDVGWFLAFAIVAVVMIAVSAWMAWFSRRTMKAHTGQIEDMVREMREAIDEDDREPPAED